MQGYWLYDINVSDYNGEGIGDGVMVMMMVTVTVR